MHDTATRHATVDSPVGELTVVRDDAGVTGVYFPQHWTRPDRTTFGPRVDAAEDGGFAEVVRELEEYFAGERHEFTVATNPQGTDRERRLWALLAEIPYGETTTYGALAQRLDDGTTAREVGRLVGSNPLSILVACHRVVGAGGDLTGYAGGLERKRHLLELERAIPPETPTLW